MEKSKQKKDKKKDATAVKKAPLGPLKNAEADYHLTVVDKKLHVTDQKTGKIININTVEDLHLLGVSLGDVKPSAKKEWDPATSAIQNFSPSQLTSLKNILSEMSPTDRK